MLKDKLQQDLKEALKARVAGKISILRMLLASIHNDEIDKKRAAQDDDVIRILSLDQKRHRDSIDQFQKGGREDLVAKEQAELEIINSYLPQPLSQVELREQIRKVISETGARGPKDFGKVMKAIMEEVKGRVDGATVALLVKEELNKVQP